MSRTPLIRRLTQAALLLALCLLLPACGKSKVNKANYDKITEGMTLEQVEGILGKGTKEEGGDGSNVAGQFGVDVTGGMGGGGGSKAITTYKWEKGDKSITVHFLNGKVSKTTQQGLSKGK
jgi:hypothetical protein